MVVRRRPVRVLALALLVALLVAACAVPHRRDRTGDPVPQVTSATSATPAPSGPPGPGAVPTVPSPADGGTGVQPVTVERTLDVGGLTRHYLLTTPAPTPQDPAPLVLVLHGGFGSAQQALEAYGWVDVAVGAGAVVVHPDGIGHAWAAGDGCCGAPGRDGVDDVAFLTALVDAVAAQVPVDRDRVYATGMSNGAMMTYRLACETDLLAAVAPVAGTVLGGCDPPAPVSVLHVHGAADTSVRPDGERGSGTQRIDGAPIVDVHALFSRAGACGPDATTIDGPLTWTRAACPGGVDVELVVVADAGHQWPGSTITDAQRRLGADEPSTALDATATAWAFFAAHERVRG